MTAVTPIPFDNTYSSLGEPFSASQTPTPVASPGLIRINDTLAQQLGIDATWLHSAEGLAALAGNAVPAGAEPIATVYAGHQFGSWNPQLGDGRAILLGEVVDTQGRRFDVQLKGAGRTPYSRGGDGRSPMGPVLREYVVSEAMHALGVPTTRALAAVSTGETVARDSFQPGAVLTRVASSHLRVGTVQFFASREDTAALQALIDYVLQRHFPEHKDADPEQRAAALLQAVIERQAELIAHWQSIGFIHGVMNTDNMLLCGETIDYGPCAFLDRYEPEKVFSSIDRGGRYAYRNQPGIGHWNSAALAQALLPMLGADKEAAVERAQSITDTFPQHFMRALLQRMRAKLGFTTMEQEDEQLIQDLLSLLESEAADYTLALRRLSELADDAGEVGAEAPGSVAGLFEFSAAFTPWLEQWQQRCSRDSQSAAERQAAMLARNPAFIPRNHLLETAITQAAEHDNLEPFQRLLERTTRPFDYDPADSDLATPPRPEQEVQHTFCGT